MKHKGTEKLRLKNWSQKVKDFAALLSAIIAIAGALICGGKWLLAEINASTNARVDALEKKIDDNQKENKLAVTRLELSSLIQSNPTNVVEIEKLGRYYFTELGGDRWMSSVYSNWCKEYGGDPNIVVK